MKSVKFGVERGKRTWLTCEYDGKEIKFNYPPFQGSHVDCFKFIRDDPELTHASGLEMALLTHGAYNSQEPEWKEVGQRYFLRSCACVRLFLRLSWMQGFDSHAGVFLEKDLNGEGVTTSMVVPVTLNNWVYHKTGLFFCNPEETQFWIPKGYYKLGKHTLDSFVKDGLAVAALTQEGAETIAKTAFNANVELGIFGYDTSQFLSPQQAVMVISDYGGKLALAGNVHGQHNEAYAFGVKKS